MFASAGTDPDYEALREPQDSYRAERRADVIALWSQTATFLDSDLTDHARVSFHAAYWEMLVAGGLREAGAELVPRERRDPRNSGPDLLSARPHAWIEAIAVKAGTGDDAVPTPELGVVHSVPDDQILLRITQALCAKNADRSKYIARGWVQESDPYVIAVNSGNIPSGKTEREPLRIVRAVFPFGHPSVLIDAESGHVTDGPHAYRNAIAKKAGALVKTTIFEDPAFAGISACLYSVADAFNPPRSLAGSLVIVHNPLATAPLQRESLRGLVQYWRDGDLLRSSRS